MLWGRRHYMCARVSAGVVRRVKLALVTAPVVPRHSERFVEKSDHIISGLFELRLINV